MSSMKKYFILVVVALIIWPLTAATQNGNQQPPPTVKKNGVNIKNTVNGSNEPRPPILAATPREIDIGTIGPGDSLTGVFTLKNRGSGILNWSTSGPEGWKTAEKSKLSGTIEDDADFLRVEVHVLTGEGAAKSRATSYPLEIKMTAGEAKLVCRKSLAVGKHRELIKIDSASGIRTIFLKFKIVSSQELAQINLNPERLDMGTVLQGKTVSKKIRLTNKGREILRWSVAPPKNKRSDFQNTFPRQGKYISFVNEEIRGSGNYVIPNHLRESMDVVGKWAEHDGYPASSASTNSIKYHFHGTGLILYFSTYPDAGNLTVYLDDKLVNEHDWFADQKEKGELLVAEGIPNGSHVVTLVNKEGHLEFEGVKILGKDVISGPAGWLTVFPQSGSTTLETEYINVNLNSAQLPPGFYSDIIAFNSNGGEGIVEVFVDIVPDKLSKSIDVYRYSKGFDFLFTANPQAEIKRLSQNSYTKDGIAFRLFMPHTPGTTSFYRWYNPQRNDHFYHYDPRGGGKQLKGYVFEGSIGNIATSRMTNTRELYRWFNHSTSHYFYTTDPKGEKAARNGYRFDGIAGYVR